ncbi:MAG: hypothetical protein ACRDG4_07165 [Chloroflexota bacterium]
MSDPGKADDPVTTKITLRLPSRAPVAEAFYRPPETEPDLAGPGRGGPLRPPTTGMLPSPQASGLVLLLVTDDQQDIAYVRKCLAYAHWLGGSAPTLVCRGIKEARLQAHALRPTLVIIGDHTALRWGAKQVALCRFLKQSSAMETPVVMLYSGRRVFGRSAFKAASPDAIIPTSTSEPLFFLRLDHLLVESAKRRRRQA